MLKATVQKIRDTIIVRCQGRIIVGENFATLNDTVIIIRPRPWLYSTWPG